MFILKKILGNLMMPLSFSLMVLILGLLMLWLRPENRRQQLFAKLLHSLGTVILLITSLPFAAGTLNVSLERAYAPLFSPPGHLQYVIVLGGGHTSDPYLPPPQRLSPPSYYRVMEGIRLMRANPRATLILSGFGGSDPVSNAHLAGVVARQYGIPASHIRLFENARDTAEEAALITPVIRQGKSALVTSASHMPRALGLFRSQGADPLPAPTFYLGKQRQNPPLLYERLPSAGNLENFSTGWHEIVGALWAKIRGWM